MVGSVDIYDSDWWRAEQVRVVVDTYLAGERQSFADAAGALLDLAERSGGRDCFSNVLSEVADWADVAAGRAHESGPDEVRAASTEMAEKVARLSSAVACARSLPDVVGDALRSFGPPATTPEADGSPRSNWARGVVDGPLGDQLLRLDEHLYMTLIDIAYADTPREER